MVKEGRKLDFRDTTPSYAGDVMLACIEVPRAAYFFAGIDMQARLKADIDGGVMKLYDEPLISGVRDYEALLSRTWNWASFFYYHETDNGSGHRFLKGDTSYWDSENPLYGVDPGFYNIGDVVFVDLNYYEFYNDNSLALPDHSGIVVGVGDPTDASTISIVAYSDGVGYVSYFTPYSDDNPSVWITSWSYGQGGIDLPIHFVNEQKNSVWVNSVDPEDNSLVTPKPIGIIYHGGF